MRYYILGLLLLTQISCMRAQLSEHRWEDRILLVFAKEVTDSTLIQQIAHFQADLVGLKDRNLVIYQLFESNGIAPNENRLNESSVEKIRQQYAVAENEFTVILIGKDGGEKLRMSSILTREQLYATIDVMPMRRAEMRRKKKGEH